MSGIKLELSRNIEEFRKDDGESLMPEGHVEVGCVYKECIVYDVRYPETIIELNIGTVALGVNAQSYRDLARVLDAAILKPIMSPHKDNQASPKTKAGKRAKPSSPILSSSRKTSLDPREDSDEEVDQGGLRASWHDEVEGPDYLTYGQAASPDHEDIDHSEPSEDEEEELHAHREVLRIAVHVRKMGLNLRRDAT